MCKYYVYYIRETADDGTPLRNRPPIGCVLFTPYGEGTVARGISICGANDRWDYGKARAVAKARLQRALQTRKSAAPIARGEPYRQTSAAFLREWSLKRGATPSQEYKSCYGAPTALERDILVRATK